MATPFMAESDPARAQRRKALRRVDRVLVVVVLTFVTLVAAGVTLLYIAPEPVDIETFGFDLSDLRVEKTLVVGGMREADRLIVLDDPQHITPEQADELTTGAMNKFLVPDDLVIGVTLNGQVRAYPLRILNWHEIVNDQVGGVPIAVTYSALSNSAVVFDRRVGADLVRFGHSGLLYNSNLLMYDRQSQRDDSSLWSQLAFVAISGPRAGQELKVLPMSVARWDHWRAQHPDTKVFRGLPDYRKKYQQNAYGHYYHTGKLKFPVEPLPPQPGRAWMTPMVALQQDSHWRAYALSDEGNAHAVPPGLTILNTGPEPTFGLDADAPMPSVYACWFAWYAMHGGDKPFSMAKSSATDRAAKPRGLDVFASAGLAQRTIGPTMVALSAKWFGASGAFGVTGVTGVSADTGNVVYE
jgi:hypothetical protein